MAESIGFLGPGLMGRGVVKNLLGKGYKVMVHAHREGMKLDDLVGAGAKVTRSLTEVAEKNGTIMLCVPSSKEVEAAILGAPGLLQGLGISQADIFRGEYNHSARDKLGILAGINHPRHIVERGIGLTRAHAFYKSTYCVVVFLSFFVVAESF